MLSVKFGKGKRNQRLYCRDCGVNFSFAGKIGPTSKDNRAYTVLTNTLYFFLVELQQFCQALESIPWTEDKHFDLENIIEFDISGIQPAIRKMHLCLIYFDKLRDEVAAIVKEKHPKPSDRKTLEYIRISTDLETAKSFISPIINCIKHSHVFVASHTVFVRLDSHTQVLPGFCLLEIDQAGSRPHEFRQKNRKGSTISLSMLGWQMLVFSRNIAEIGGQLLAESDVKSDADIAPQLEHWFAEALSSLFKLPIYALDDADFLREFEVEILKQNAPLIDCFFGSADKKWSISKSCAFQCDTGPLIFNGEGFGGILADSNFTLYDATISTI